MGIGDIVKKAWSITWRYKTLWVIGLFAGITGPSGSFAGNSSYGTGSSDFSSMGLPSADSTRALQWFYSALPIIGGILAALIVLWLGWIVLGVAARAGLVHQVNEAEEGRPVSAGDGWSVGWRLWGRTVILEILLKLPMFLLVMIALAVVFVPIVSLVAAGNSDLLESTSRLAGAGVLSGVCGAIVLLLVVGIPLGFVLGILYVVGLRYLVLADMGATQAISAAWGALKSRFKDHIVMWFVSWLLTLASSFVLAIPVVIVGVATVIPVIAAVQNRSWGMAIGSVGVAVLGLMCLSFVYSAIWGTYTSALWTVFFRRLTGREIVVAPLPVGVPAYAPPVAPAPAPPAPPVAPE
ncbi:MAG: hypothetical protein Q8K89_14065 [Actinomycetota bacterium]|nr:hypothetical protein [Actinomycetota bacterium]